MGRLAEMIRDPYSSLLLEYENSQSTFLGRENILLVSLLECKAPEIRRNLYGTEAGDKR